MAIIVVKVWKGGSHGLHFPYLNDSGHESDICV